MLNVSAVHEYVTGFPVFVLSLPGTNPSLPSILLNSHYDVVPIMSDYWKYPAFEAPVVDGNIIARGSQDMKCVCSAYLEALLRLRAAGFTHSRSIHAAFMVGRTTTHSTHTATTCNRTWAARLCVVLT